MKNQKSYTRRQSGFTFVELLVVISIIAVLMAIAAVSYSSTTKKSRDAKRVADMEQIRSALEICRSEDGSYPVDGSVVAGAALTCTGGSTTLSKVPLGPKGAADNYAYDQTSATTYTLTNTQFESIANCPYPSGGNCVATQP